MDPVGVFHAGFYMLHNEKRLEHLASLKLPIEKDMTVLEVGAGIGDHTPFFLNLECDVTTTEGRRDNFIILKQSFGKDAKVGLLDLEKPVASPMFDKKFDIVYCYGTLYHLSTPEKSLEYMAERCGSMLLLETCVSFGNDLKTGVCHEHAGDPSQSVSGHGCRPTRPWLYNKLKSLFGYVYMPKTQPNHKEFPADWTKPSNSELTRSVFIASRTPIDNKLLVEELLMRQETYKK